MLLTGRWALIWFFVWILIKVKDMSNSDISNTNLSTSQLSLGREECGVSPVLHVRRVGQHLHLTAPPSCLRLISLDNILYYFSSKPGWKTYSFFLLELISQLKTLPVMWDLTEILKTITPSIDVIKTLIIRPIEAGHRTVWRSYRRSVFGYTAGSGGGGGWGRCLTW